MKKYIKLLKISIVIFGTYLINFIFLPLVSNNVQGNDINNASLVSTIIFSIIGILFLIDKLYCWLVSDVVCFLLAMLYHPPKIYDIGTKMTIGFPILNEETPHYDRSIAWEGILLCVVVYFLIHLFVWGVIKISKSYWNKRNK